MNMNRNALHVAVGRALCMKSVNFGIFMDAYQKDMESHRRELLQIDVIIPWVLCLKDLALYRSLNRVPVPDLTDLLPAGQPKDCIEQCCIRARDRLGANSELFAGYTSRFRSLLNECGWNEKAAVAWLR